MIHVRYHLITIAAIFLALGIGILLGGTAGQSWFSLTEKEFLRSMEAKYDKALKSNNELKQQVNRLIIQVERSNEEVIHLMAARYAEDLQGQKVYVWHPPELSIDELQRVLQSVGVEVQTYQPDRQMVEDPLLIIGRELPSWARLLPSGSKWLHVESMPDSPAKQWKLLESVQMLMKEKRVELEKR
ncbi:copper transporter [Brevibacillus sp. SYP-B805]|uniref:copper transporter n=1 Tax=Brevibacillus sp. SYP-B805 TaxID=1578199 RepID=UPI0013EC1834|nr:copper transporter [Brevibacillus sp. SYP-B805]NGQ94686.1 copper transporter [Brevibacillus sp. SYP-B805]